MKIRINPWPNILGAAGAGLIVVFFCLLLLWHDPFVFWNDDYEVSILPVFQDVARSWSEGDWPLLSPSSWVCANLAGEYQYGTFSIFVNAAVVLIWKLPLLFSQQAAALSIVHLFVLAAGGFLLARDRKVSASLSMMVAFVAALSGWMVCWGATDWFGALGAFAWLPWSWWGLERALDPTRSRWRFLWPALFVYLLVTGGFPYTVVMLAVLIGWLAIRSITHAKSVTSVLPMLFGVALGVGMSAPAWLAIFDYVRGSARELQPVEAHWQWIVPPAALPGLILPCWTAKWTDFSNRFVSHTGTELASGLVPPLTIIWAVLTQTRTFVRRFGWELGLLLFVLTLSMLPTAGVFRWSFRWLPFLHLIMALSAAEVLQWREEVENVAKRRNISLGLTAIVVVGLVASAMFIFGTTGRNARPLVWIYLALALIWFVADAVRDRIVVRLAWVPSGIVFVALLATYFCIRPNCGVPKYNLPQSLKQPAPLDPARLYLSFYPLPEIAYRVENRLAPVGETVRPGSTPMWAGLHFINGYSPILAAGVPRELKFAIHGEIDFNTGRNLIEKQSGPSELLETLGVDGIIVAQEYPGTPSPEAFQLVVSNQEGRVFQRRGGPLPRVRSVEWIDSRPDEEFTLAKIGQIQERRNRVDVDLEVPTGGQPALITFSRPYFPGYRARLGDKALPVESYRGFFPTVELPAGAHGRLVLRYCPSWLVYGGAVAIFSALIFMISAGMCLRERRRLSGAASIA